ncbi:MAG: hypothetical protein M9916_11390 [Crocinitomicaceae bacterium]|nr:hypothetical protein [Crocinitomicaceae bacterium]
MFILVVFNGYSQDETIIVNTEDDFVNIQEIKPKHTFNVVLGLPNTLINKPFESIMRGIVDVNPYYQFHLPNSIGFGAGIRYTHFTINEFRVPEKLDGVMHAAGAFFKFGYERFYTRRFAFDASVKFGYNWFFVVTDLNKLRKGGPYKFDAGFVEPTIGFILSATDKSSFRLTIGYTIQGFIFKPSMLGTEMNGGWDAKQYSKTSQFITFGLGYTYYIGKNNN